MGDAQTPTLSLDLSKYPKLDAAQAGHIRHIHNLTTQLDGQWHHMAGVESHQELFDSFRYQIAMMTYTAGVAHYHRLPAMRSLFKRLFNQLIHKMRLRDVWGYWYIASHSGTHLDPDLTELRKPWINPIVKENIMYSGHLLLMTSLYAMLFDDDKFEQKDALTFTWKPALWGMGQEVFPYDNRSIQTAILEQLDRSNWIGVCCEPNLVFVVCNTFPIIAMRYNDSRDGTNVADEALAKFQKAWEKKGMIAANGMYYDYLYYNQDKLAPPYDIAITAWTNAYTNIWNSELINSLYERQALGYIVTVDGQTRLHTHEFALEYRKLVEKLGSDYTGDTAELVEEARALKIAANLEPMTFPDPAMGCVLLWLSEIGRTTELQGLLDYCDASLEPTWEKGGLYYPRRDVPEVRPETVTHVDTFTGNAGVAYARLNVKDGQKKMWDQPWTREYLAARPWVDGVDLTQGVDALRGLWDSDSDALILTLKTWEDRPVTVTPVARNLPAGSWAVYVNGVCSKVQAVEEKGDFAAQVTVGSTDVDIVFQRLSASS